MATRIDQSTDGRLNGLDSLRAFAIVAVLLFHYQGLGGLWSHPAWMENSVIKLGWSGVDLFFVLSGYLIGSHLLIELEKTGGLSLKTFYTKRSFRILPPYLFILGVYVVCPGAREQESLAPLIKYLTFTQNLGFEYGDHNTFSHAWSLCIEEQFYLVLPLVLLTACACRLRRSPVRVVVITCVFVVAGILIRVAIFSWISGAVAPAERYAAFLKWIYYPTYSRLDGLLVGVFIAWVFQYRTDLREWLTQRHRWCLAGALILLCSVWGLSLFPLGSNWSLFYLSANFPLFSLAYGLLVVAAISPGSMLYRFRSRPVAHLATLSYSIYLSHKIMIHLGHSFLEARGFGMESNTVLLISMGLCLLAGLAMHHMIERPALLVRNRLLSRQRGRSAELIKGGG